MKFFLLRISPNASAPYFKKSYTLKKKLARVRDVADRDILHVRFHSCSSFTDTRK